jgi:excisionase family DNA binding protein
MLGDMLTVEDIATCLKVNVRTVYRMIEKKQIPCFKIGRQWRFDQEVINRWLNDRIIEPTVRALVIDDDPDVCSLFIDTLDDTRHSVVTANDAEKGLEYVIQEDFDLVFLDLKLPKIDGAELFGRIRKIKPFLPVMIVTGFPDSELMKKALTYGPISVISKPLKPGDILSAVNSCIRTL